MHLKHVLHIGGRKVSHWMGDYNMVQYSNIEFKTKPRRSSLLLFFCHQNTNAKWHILQSSIHFLYTRLIYDLFMVWTNKIKYLIHFREHIYNIFYICQNGPDLAPGRIGLVTHGLPALNPGNLSKFICYIYIQPKTTLLPVPPL